MLTNIMSFKKQKQQTTKNKKQKNQELKQPVAL